GGGGRAGGDGGRRDRRGLGAHAIRPRRRLGRAGCGSANGGGSGARYLPRRHRPPRVCRGPRRRVRARGSGVLTLGRCGSDGRDRGREPCEGDPAAGHSPEGNGPVAPHPVPQHGCPEGNGRPDREALLPAGDGLMLATALDPTLSVTALRDDEARRLSYAIAVALPGIGAVARRIELAVARDGDRRHVTYWRASGDW